jgi:hypothetical protein
MKTSIKELMIEGFGGPNSQIFYTSKVNDGLWISEKHFINKYFTKKKLEWVRYYILKPLSFRIKQSGFTLVEISDTYQISDKDVQASASSVYLPK